MTLDITLRERRGFTLIELLLYVGLMAVMLLVSSLFMSFVLEARVKNQVIDEVEQQGLYTMQLIEQTVRNADAINSPAQGVNGASLSLAVPVPNNPTVFSLVSGAIQVTEAGGAAVGLTNSRVTASSVSFYNLSRTGTPGVVRIQFTLTHTNPSGRNEYNYNQTFYGSAALHYP